MTKAKHRPEKSLSRLFAYGTLCDPDLRKKVLGRACRTAPACLKGYKCQKGKWPYIQEGAGRDTPGLVLFDLKADDFARLDAYEGLEPEKVAGRLRRFYTREIVKVEIEGKKQCACWVYAPNLPDWPSSWR